MNEEKWYSTKEAAEIVGVSERTMRARAKFLLIAANAPKYSGKTLIREAISVKGKKRIELTKQGIEIAANHSGIAEAIAAKEPQSIPSNETNSPHAPATEPIAATDIGIAATIAEVFPQNKGEIKEEVFELGMHIQEDGTIVQVFTLEEFDTFRERLIELPLVKKTVNELKESYESHVQTYRNEVDYLRKSLEKQQEMTQRLTSIIQERNFIEASEMMKDRENS
jgi:hypothetical protein